MQKLLDYNYIYLVPLLLCAITSLKTFRLEWHKSYRTFAIFIWLILLIEVLAITWKWYLYRTAYWNFPRSNLWIYNFFLIVRLIFYLLFYYQHLSSYKTKNIIRYSIIPLIFFGLLDYFFIETPNQVNTYSIVLDHLIIMLLSLYYFSQVLNDKVVIKLSTHPMIWISLGTFIYFSGTLPFFISLSYISRNNASLAISMLYINTALNTLMYSFYLISFLCKPQIQ